MWDRDQPTSAEAGDTSSVTPLHAPASSTSLTSIGRSVLIEGELIAQEDLTLEGTVKGSVRMRDNAVTLGAGGRVEGDIEAREVTIDGSLEGNAVVGDRITVRPSGSVQGDLAAPRVVLEDGARFSGRIDTEGSAADPVEATA